MSDDKTTISHIAKYYTIYAVIVSLIVTWTTMLIRLDSQHVRIENLEVQSHANEIGLAEINSRLASIETSLEFIKKAID